MTNPPDVAEKNFKFRTGLIPAIRKRLTLANYPDMEQWIVAAELAEADLLLESKGTTELTNGLLKDHQSGKHLINYHEGLQQEATPLCGVLALGISETQSPKEDKDATLKLMQKKIEQLEAEMTRMKHEGEPRDQAFPFRSQNNQHHQQKSGPATQKQAKPNPNFGKAKRHRSQHKNSTKKTKRESQKGGPIANTWR